MNAPLVVTIDGPSGVGKSTLARLLAEELRIAFLDTGAMFRIIAYVLRPEASMPGEEELVRRLNDFSFALEGTGKASRMTCNGRQYGEEIRTEDVALAASRLATMHPVRERLKEAQRAMGQTTPLVAEGRDMGTVVFPNARYKFFLDAAPEVRALRRAEQLAASGQTVDLAELTARIRDRDVLDRGRAIAPLIPASDALLLNTDELSIQGVLSLMLERVHSGDHSA